MAGETIATREAIATGEIVATSEVTAVVMIMMVVDTNTRIWSTRDTVSAGIRVCTMMSWKNLFNGGLVKN